MKTVTFLKRYEHRLNASQVAVYRAGRRYSVSPDVLAGAEAAGAVKPAKKRLQPAAGEQA